MRLDGTTRQQLRFALDEHLRATLEPPCVACPGCGGSLLEGCATIDCATCVNRLGRRRLRAA